MSAAKADAPVKPQGYEQMRFVRPVTFQGRTFEQVNLGVASDVGITITDDGPLAVRVEWRGQVRRVPWSNVVDATPASPKEAAPGHG